MSASKAPSGLSVWARIGSGQWATLVLRDDGSFHGTLSTTGVPVGAAQITVVTTDYAGNAIERIVACTVTR